MFIITVRLAGNWSSGSYSGGVLGMGLGYCSTWKTCTGTLGRDWGCACSACSWDLGGTLLVLAELAALDGKVQEEVEPSPVKTFLAEC